MARSTLVPRSFSNLEAGRAVHSGTGVPAGGGTPRHLPAHGTSIQWASICMGRFSAHLSPACTTIHPRRLLVLARAPTTSRARPILIGGLGYAGINGLRHFASFRGHTESSHSLELQTYIFTITAEECWGVNIALCFRFLRDT